MCYSIHVNKILQYIIYIFSVIGLILTIGYIAVELGLTKNKGIIDNQHDYFKNQILSSTNAWIHTEEWSILKDTIVKDKEDLIEATKVVGIPVRILIAPLIVEQLRLYYSNREIFKSIFAPLKILGNQSQFSWGVMGIKQNTAREIEENLKDSKSPWYLGKKYENILDFKTDNPDKERFERLTDEHDRYYSYLYTAILIKQLEIQWEKAGIPIDDYPDIISTLFNIGFENSHPHANPQSGGAEIDIGDIRYSFGSLAESFYNSEELLDEFPK